MVPFTPGSTERYIELYGTTNSYKLPESVVWAYFDNLTSISSYISTDLKAIFMKDTSNVTSIRSDSFYNCKNLTGKLTLPPNIVAINSSAFENCENLIGDLPIPSGVTNIAYKAFKGCTGLSGELIIPGTCANIGTEAFAGTNFSHVIINRMPSPSYQSTNIYNLTRPGFKVYVPDAYYNHYTTYAPISWMWPYVTKLSEKP